MLQNQRRPAKRKTSASGAEPHPPEGGPGSTGPAGGFADSRFFTRTKHPSPPTPRRRAAPPPQLGEDGSEEAAASPGARSPPGPGRARGGWVAKRRPRAPHNAPAPPQAPAPLTPPQAPEGTPTPQPAAPPLPLQPGGGGEGRGGAGARHGLPGLVVAACFASLPLLFPHGRCRRYRGNAMAEPRPTAASGRSLVQ